MIHTIINKKRLKTIINILPLILMIIFYLTLFYLLKNKLLFTPDFGESDAYHLNLSLKYFLSDSLKHNLLPFWTDKLQGGFPLMAEGQIGALFLPNIIFLKLLPFTLGYNLLLIFSLFCLTSGFYLLLKELKIRTIIAFLLAFIFTFNGAISLRWVHLNLIQSFSLTPFLFYFLIKYQQTKKKKYLILFPIFLSQMIFAGYLPIVFVSLLGLSLWYLFDSKKSLPQFGLLIFLIITGLLMAGSQLLPTYKLMQQSSRTLSQNYEFATSFPMTFSNLIGYVNPFAFGNPRLGTYPPYSSDWGIFWENTPYLGVIFMGLLAVSFLISIVFKHVNKSKSIVYLWLVLIFILLALGKNSPFYFIFNFFPFNLFRTPPRYLIMANFFLIIFSGLLLENIIQSFKKIKLLTFFIAFVLVGSIVQLIIFTFNYHLFVDQKILLSAPAITKYLKNNDFYISLGQAVDWNKIFLTYGWNKKEDQEQYLFLKNYLYPNSNLIYGLKNTDYNSGGFKLKRPETINDMITNLLSTGKKSESESASRLMNVYGINYVISNQEIKNEKFKLDKKLKLANFQIFLYRLKQANNQIYFVPGRTSKINYLEDYLVKFDDGNDFLTNSVVENSISVSNNNTNFKINKVEEKENSVSLKGTFSKNTFLVFKKNYYPEWQVLIDGKTTPIIKTNLTQIGVTIPPGTHNINLIYNNEFFKQGCLITVFALVFLTIGLILI